VEAMKRQAGRGKANEKPAATPAPAEKASQEEARRKFTRIDSFEGGFDFLALEAPFEAAWDGTVYATALHAFLAAQYPAAAAAIAEAASVDEARTAAREESEVDEWSTRKKQIMEKIQRDKFRRSADIRKRLQETGDRELAWENDEDGFWGTVKGKGQNQLGRILMEVRTSIQDETEFDTWLFLCCELEDDAVKRPPVEILELKPSEEGGQAEQKKVHRLNDRAYFKFGKLPSNAVVLLHPSLSREHAMLLHTRSKLARRSQGIVLLDLGSKAGTSIGERKLPHSWVMEPVRNGDIIRLGASTRTLEVKVNLASQIEQLEAQERALRKEVDAIDADAENPLEAAKRAAREEATVFVGNLDYETEKADMLGLFQDCGHIEEVRFPGKESTKAERGFCFVVFDSAMAARRACGLNSENYNGRKVKVTPASENRRAETDGGGKGGGKNGGKSGGKKGGDRDGGKGGGGGKAPEGSRALFEAEKSSRQARSPRRRSPERSPRRRSPRRGSPARRSRSCSRSRRGAERRPARRSPSNSPPRKHRGDAGREEHRSTRPRAASSNSDKSSGSSRSRRPPAKKARRRS